MSKQFVIIGTSAAGMGALTSILRADPHAHVILISDEPYLPYNKCYLVDYLSGNKTHEQLFTRDAAFFESNPHITFIKERVVHIDGTARAVRLASGMSIGYDALCLATGSRARPWHAPGSTARGIFSFYSLTDSYALHHYLAQQEVRTAVVIGAGLTGIECADALTARGIAVTLIDCRERVLPALLTPAGSAYVHTMLHAHGVRFIDNDSVVYCAESQGSVQGVFLASGAYLPAQLVIVALGAEQDTTLAASAGIDCGPQGIVTSSTLATSVDAIWAAGDIIMTRDIITGNTVRSCMWRDAVAQGVAVGNNMIGIATAYSGVTLHATSEFFNRQFISAGNLEDVRSYHADHGYYAWNIVDQRLKGFIIIGASTHKNTLRRLYVTQAPCTDQLVHELITAPVM